MYMFDVFDDAQAIHLSEPPVLQESTLIPIPSDEILKPFSGRALVNMQPIDNATYSDPADDIAVHPYFFDISATSLSLRNCIPSEVLLRVSTQPA
ncbi:hypothetical protein Tco_0596241 [Tanacetum coccineum]